MRVKNFTSICHHPIAELTNHPRVTFLRPIYLYAQFLMVLRVALHQAFVNPQTLKRSKFDSEPFAEVSCWRKAAEEAVALLPAVSQSSLYTGHQAVVLGLHLMNSSKRARIPCNVKQGNEYQL